MQQHPITKGLDVVYMRFVSSLDTVLAQGIRKTPLLFSSDFARILPAPARVAFRDMQEEPDVDQFATRNLPLAYLLEGDFTSLFKNRFIPEEFAQENFKENGSGKVVVIGDGEVFQSQKDPVSGGMLTLGDDPFNQLVFANKLFLRNLSQYLVNPEGIIASRNKAFQIRPLNKVKVAQQKSFWQTINVLVPVLILLIAGGLISTWRVRKFSKKTI